MPEQPYIAPVQQGDSALRYGPGGAGGAPSLGGRRGGLPPASALDAHAPGGRSLWQTKNAEELAKRAETEANEKRNVTEEAQAELALFTKERNKKIETTKATNRCGRARAGWAAPVPAGPRRLSGAPGFSRQPFTPPLPQRGAEGGGVGGGGRQRVGQGVQPD